MVRGMAGMLPIDALRTAVSAMSGSEAEPVDNSHEGTIRKGIRDHRRRSRQYWPPIHA